jgi:hypothetical protein
VLRHEDWWKQIVRGRTLAGASAISFDPEFGPPPTYMPAMPFTQEPVADLWDVRAWMADRFRVLVAEVAAAYSSGPSR